MSVLDDMTRGITDRKAAAAGPKLTPVGTEASGTKPSAARIPDVPTVFLTNEALHDVAKDLRRQAGLLIEVADGLDVMTAPVFPDLEEAGLLPKATKEAKRLEGKEPEVPFAETYATLVEKAKAATFTAADAPAEEPTPPAPATGWACPQHGAESLATLTSRKGRVYTACTVKGCDHFERES